MSNDTSLSALVDLTLEPLEPLDLTLDPLDLTLDPLDTSGLIGAYATNVTDDLTISVSNTATVTIPDTITICDKDGKEEVYDMRLENLERSCLNTNDKFMVSMIREVQDFKKQIAQMKAHIEYLERQVNLLKDNK